MEEIGAIGKEVIPTIVLGKDTLVKIKEVGKSIQINIQHKDSSIFKKKPIDQATRNLITNKLSETKALNGRFKDIKPDDKTKSINLKIKDGKYSVFLNGQELKPEIEEAITENLAEGATAILGEDSNVNVEKDGDTYILRLTAIDPEAKVEIRKKLEQQGVDVSNFDKTNLVRIKKDKNGNLIHELKTVVETEEGLVRAGNGFLRTKQKATKEFKDIKKATKELGGKLKNFIGLGEVRASKLSKIDGKYSEDGYNRNTGIPLSDIRTKSGLSVITSSDRKQIDSHKPKILEIFKSVSEEDLPNKLIEKWRENEDYKINLEQEYTSKNEDLKKLDFLKSFGKDGKNLRKEIKESRKDLELNKFETSAIRELTKDTIKKLIQQNKIETVVNDLITKNEFGKAYDLTSIMIYFMEKPEQKLLGLELKEKINKAKDSRTF